MSTSLAIPLDASNAAFHGKDSHSLELVLNLLDYAEQADRIATPRGQSIHVLLDFKQKPAIAKVLVANAREV